MKQITKCIFNIKSGYIVDNIFTYIKEKEFKLKLFKYSKEYQKKFNINIFDYMGIFLDNIGINVFNYIKLNLINISEKNNNDIFDKNQLSVKLKEDLFNWKIDINDFKKYITEYKNYNKSQKIEINIYSPFFYELSNLNNFVISISSKFIKKYSLINDYIKAFNRLNNSQSRYSGILFKFNYTKDINYLKKNLT